MKLDLNCIRDTLLALENYAFFIEDNNGDILFESLSLDELCALLPEYSKADLCYTIRKLSEADFISLYTDIGDDVIGLCEVLSLTYAGHELLENIRSDTVWQKASAILEKLSCHSLNLLSDACSAILSSMLQKLL